MDSRPQTIQDSLQSQIVNRSNQETLLVGEDTLLSVLRLLVHHRFKHQLLLKSEEEVSQDGKIGPRLKLR